MKRVVINGGYLIDPANRISSKLNIAIENGKVVEISNEALNGDEAINAEGLIVSPGFIDAHMHEDPYDEKEDKFEISIFECMLKMGVTTAIGGNCGSGPRNVPQYIDAVNRLGLPVNFGLLVPHNTLRYLEGIENKYDPAPKDKVLNMAKKAKKYLQLGCLGISFGIRYIPGLNTFELMQVSSACQEDNKIIAAHVRDDAANIIPSAQELIDVGLELGLPVQVSHIGSMGAYGQMAELLALIDYHKSNGLDISSDCYPYNAFSTGIGETTYDDGFLERYGTTYETIELAEGKYKGQRCTKEIFEELRREAPETITIGHVMKEEDVDLAMAHPNVMVASDGFMHNYQGHPRAAGTFPRVINKYVKEKKVVTLYQAIEKMTSLPAKRFGIDKGSLGIGSDADIVIFNFDEIKDNATFEKPALPPDGIKYVIIGGNIALKENEILNDKLGRFVGK